MNRCTTSKGRRRRRSRRKRIGGVCIRGEYFSSLSGDGKGWGADVELVLRRCAAAFFVKSAVSVCVFVVRLLGIYMCMDIDTDGYGSGRGGQIGNSHGNQAYGLVLFGWKQTREIYTSQGGIGYR